MNEINRSISTELLEDIFVQLKKNNLGQLLRRKYRSVSNSKEYVYYDIRYRAYGSHSFILLRNAIESYCNIQQEMILLCRCIQVEQSVTHYAVELFDKFFTNLISNALKYGLLKSRDYSIELTPQFGVNIWRLTSMKKKNFECLYLQLENDPAFCKYARTICMVVCIFIASKQFECMHLQVTKLSSFLCSLGVPYEYCNRNVLFSIERKILNIVKFELNITPLKIYVESILLILSRCLLPTLFKYYITPEKMAQMRTICLILVENYYMLQVPFLIKLFRIFNEREFNFYLLTDVDDVENLNRDKLLIASAIVAATSTLVNDHCDNMPILRFISYISEIDLTRVERACNAVLQYLFIGPLENTGEQRDKDHSCAISLPSSNSSSG